MKTTVVMKLDLGVLQTATIQRYLHISMIYLMSFAFITE